MSVRDNRLKALEILEMVLWKLAFLIGTFCLRYEEKWIIKTLGWCSCKFGKSERSNVIMMKSKTRCGVLITPCISLPTLGGWHDDFGAGTSFPVCILKEAFVVLWLFWLFNLQNIYLDCFEWTANLSLCAASWKLATETSRHTVLWVNVTSCRS